jgi:CheY-like chemotaxis protein
MCRDRRQRAKASVRYARPVADPDRRHGDDRRHHRRGGRRTQDRTGQTPLILVVSARANERDRLNTVLQDVGFAVAPCDGAHAAITAARDLLPDVIVADVEEGVALRGRVPAHRRGTSIPIVDLTGGSVEGIVRRVRLALRIGR